MRFNQRNGDAFFTGAAGTTDTVQIDIGGARHVEVKHVADIRDINTACGDVGGDQHVHATIGQAFNRFVALNLHHLALQPAGVNPCFVQLSGEFVNALALTHEDDGAGCFRLLQQMNQQRGFMLDIVGAIVPLMNFFTFAGRWGSGDFNRLFQQAFGKIFDRIAFQRGGEQHGLLAPP